MKIGKGQAGRPWMRPCGRATAWPPSRPPDWRVTAKSARDRRSLVTAHAARDRSCARAGRQPPGGLGGACASGLTKAAAPAPERRWWLPVARRRGRPWGQDLLATPAPAAASP